GAELVDEPRLHHVRPVSSGLGERAGDDAADLVGVGGGLTSDQHPSILAPPSTPITRIPTTVSVTLGGVCPGDRLCRGGRTMPARKSTGRSVAFTAPGLSTQDADAV